MPQNKAKRRLNPQRGFDFSTHWIPVCSRLLFFGGRFTGAALFKLRGH